MFLATAFVAAMAMSPQLPLSCPITGDPIVKTTKSVEYNGAKFQFCCPGCDQQFIKNPAAAIAKSANVGKTVGVFLFDPISKQAINPEKAMGGSSDFGGIRFFFESEADKKAFDASPEKFGILPKSEVLYCAVSAEQVQGYAKASGYADYQGVRYYFCCPSCDQPFAKNPAKYAAVPGAKVKSPSALPMPAAKSSHGHAQGGH